MHSFSNLISYVVNFNKDSITQTENDIVKKLETCASTPLVLGLQTLQYQIAIVAIGMFSVFDAYLQKTLKCENGFQTARKNLLDNNQNDLVYRFDIITSAINVLKHGKGRSYEYLLSIKKDLPFKIKLPNDSHFHEGDVSEIDTLIQIDLTFLSECEEVIKETCKVLQIQY